MKRMQNQIAIVTGAANGIGRAIALRLHQAGASVLAIDRDEAAISGLPSDPGIVGMSLDLTAPDAADTAVSRCVEEFGGLSVLVNNVGKGNGTPVHATSDQGLDEALEFNLKIGFRMSRAALPHLRSAGGNIVNIASALGFMGMPGIAAYSAAKGGVIGLTRQMAAEYGPDGVRVNAIAPGIIETAATADRLANNPRFRSLTLGATPLGRVGNVEDIANAALFLASAEAAFVSGHVLVVDGAASTSFHRE